MDSSIVSRDQIRAKARRAHAASKGRDDHNMNWHADAVPVWQEEWDRCERERLQAQQRSRRRGNHITDAGNKLGQQLEAA